MVPPDSWNVAIFSSRETPALLLQTVRAVVEADRPSRQGLVADVLVNGNPDLASAIGEQLSSIGSIPPHTTIRVWKVAQPDKAYTWNVFVHDIWPGGSITFFVDGYAAVDPPALKFMAEALGSQPAALAASCVPRMGPSSRSLRQQLLTKGGIQGNLYALPRESMRRVRECRFRLPAGIYRTDPLLHAVLCFQFDPAVHAWSRSKVIVVKEASYAYQRPSLFRLSDLRSYVKRRFRQAQGLIEGRAFRHHLAVMKRPPHALPATAFDLMHDWCNERPAEASRLFRSSPLSYFAYRSVLRRGRPSWAATPPELVVERSDD